MHNNTSNRKINNVDDDDVINVDFYESNVGDEFNEMMNMILIVLWQK